MARLTALRSCLFAISTLVILAASPTNTAAGTCNVATCNAQITVSQYTGPIQMGCDLEDVKVRIQINYNCGPDCSGQFTFHRCGASSEVYPITICGQDYIVGVQGTWADALVECNHVSFVLAQ